MEVHCGKFNFEKRVYRKKNIEEKSLPSTGETKSSKEATESLSSAEIIRKHFQVKADKAAAEEAAKKKEEDDQNTHF